MNDATCCPAVTSIVRLPPAITFPLPSRNERVSVPAEPARSATPVFWFAVPPTATGNEIDREVTVVADDVAAMNDGWLYRVATFTAPFENTRAKPPVSAPALLV